MAIEQKFLVALFFFNILQRRLRVFILPWKHIFLVLSFHSLWYLLIYSNFCVKTEKRKKCLVNKYFFNDLPWNFSRRSRKLLYSQLYIYEFLKNCSVPQWAILHYYEKILKHCLYKRQLPLFPQSVLVYCLFKQDHNVWKFKQCYEDFFFSCCLIGYVKYYLI